MLASQMDVRVEAVAVEHYFGISHIGHVRAENQDVWRAMVSQWAFVVADGMGGRKAGRHAAEVAVETLCAHLEGKGSDPQKEMRAAIVAANQEVFAQSHTHETEGMGTTLAVLWFVGKRALCAHVGDSRIYALRGTTLRCLTRDHTLFQEGYPGVDESCKHILSRAVGIAPAIEPTFQMIAYQPGDLFLLCSDGLTNSISEKEIAWILSQRGGLDILAQKLMQTALDLGGRDNITFILVRKEQ